MKSKLPATTRGVGGGSRQQSSPWRSPHFKIRGGTTGLDCNKEHAHLCFYLFIFITHQEFVSPGRTVSSDFYYHIFRGLRKDVLWKRLELWRNRNWLLHHNNAPVHTFPRRRRSLKKKKQPKNMAIVPHPLYSPDLAPCDFALFLKIETEAERTPFRYRYWNTNAIAGSIGRPSGKELCTIF